MASLRGRWVLVCGLSFAAALLASNEARAASGYDTDERNEVFSLTFSPLHLFFPAVEVQGEYKVVDGLGVSLIGAYGWPSAEAIDERGNEIDVRFDLIEVGGQIMYYPIRRFRSLQLGIEAVYVHLSTSEPVGDYDASAFGGGFGVGPLVGFKFIAGPGITGFVQLGVSYIAVEAEATDSTGARATEEDSGFQLNLNLNLGWSF